MAKNGKTKIDVAVLQVQFGEMGKHMERLAVSMEGLERKFENLEAGRLSAIEVKYATISADVGVIKKLVYGTVGIVLSSVVIAILTLVLKS